MAFGYGCNPGLYPRVLTAFEGGVVFVAPFILKFMIGLGGVAPLLLIG